MNKMMFGTAAVLGLSGAVLAGSVISVPDFTIGEHLTGDQTDDPLVQFSLAADDGLYESVTISYTHTEDPEDSTWASDLVAQMTFDNGELVDYRGTFAGSGSALDETAATQNSIWDFDGFGSNDNGDYSHTFVFTSPVEINDGILDIAFSDVWQGGYSVTNMTIELTPVPAPGAMALLGLAGFGGLARRRRA